MSLALDDELGQILIEGVGAIFAYAAVGLALFVLGFYIVDWTTPGRLISIIRRDRSPNATFLACAATIGIGLIVAVSIYSAGGDLLEGLIRVAVFGGVGVIAQAIAVLVFDRLVGVDVRGCVKEPKLEPAVVLLGVANVAIGLVTAMAVYG
ncbi:DUF350 domain-containing protein [Actinomadura rubrobrunea]|uniref:DUF350 domain-containing protein n=1 Tax=Actinomadura rubrobrunea TaxID=115335 RepID=A0A9W6PT71_9ACTN|nr:DUF350 domain-containing protein [Actinomadura rubrobrunea]GLW62771.1 DUF350 domain-containing protein [Actinomadura rubrobrunea]